MVCYYFLHFTIKKKPPLVYPGKICGYDLSLHKHDDLLDEITANIPFIIEMINNQPILKLKSDSSDLDCEVKQTYRLYIRAYDCAPIGKRRYSERYVRRKKRIDIFFFFSICLKRNRLICLIKIFHLDLHW